jgi:general secretion pathway protein D
MEDRVLNSATKLLVSALVLAIIGLPQCAKAGVQTPLPLLLSAASLGADNKNPVAQADELLHEARQAMSEGNLEIADSKISAAEKLAPKYPPFHMGDNPKRARADLDKLLAQKAVGSDRNAKAAVAKSVGTANAATDPSTGHKDAAASAGASAPGADSLAANPSINQLTSNLATQNSTTADLPGIAAPGMNPLNPTSIGLNSRPSAPANNFGSAQGISSGPLGLRAPSSAGLAVNAPLAQGGLQVPGNLSAASPDQEEPNPWEMDAARVAHSAAAEPVRGAARIDDQRAQNQISAKAQSDRLLLEARRALARDDVRNAQIRVDQAKGLGIGYGPMDDSPAKIEALIQKTNNLPTNPATANTESFRRLRAEVWMEQAEGLLRWREYDEAERLAGEVQKLGIEYSPFEPKPEQLLQRIDTAKRAAGLPITDRRALTAAVKGAAATIVSATSVDPAAKQRAIEMAKQARDCLARGEIAAAEQIARQGEMLVPDTAFAPADDRPTLVLLDIQRAKRSNDAGAVRQASNFSNDTNRYPGMTALYNSPADSSRNAPAADGLSQRTPSMLPPTAPNLLLPAPAIGALSPTSNMLPTPENGTGEALRWYHAGVDAVAKGRSDEARRDFRQAYAFQAELDAVTRKQLVDHLRILGDTVDPTLNFDPSVAETAASALIPPEARSGLITSAASGPPQELPGAVSQASLAPLTPLSIASAAKIPVPIPEPLPNNDAPAKLGATGATGQALARQVAAEVSKQQSLARELKTKQPKQALDSLQHTRDMVASVSGLEQPARDQLLRGLDKSINELKQYIAQNASQIDLEERNRKVQQSVDRGRLQKVEVQEKLAYLVNDFDKLMDEQRYSEAQVLAKRATELDPDNPLVTQMNVMARMIPRMAQIHQIQDAKEDGFIKMLAAVDESSIPPSSDFSFPDKPKWEALQKSKYRQLKDDQSRRSPKEQEIEQRLVTPVPVKFEKKPLSEVIEVLGGYAQIPTYLDPQALASEGVGSEIPITIDLRQDISLRSALKLILEPLRLTYVIKDEVLKVTSEDVRRGELIQKVYPVGDLIVPIPNFVPNGREGINGALREGFQRNGWAGAAGGFGMPGPVTVAANEQGANVNTMINPSLMAQMQKAGINVVGGSGQNGSTPAAMGAFGPGGLKGGNQADFDSLINLITSTIAAPTWDDVGGQGTIQPFNTNLSLVVSQTQEVHEQIADLLQQLRRLQDLQVTIEVRFITLQDDFFERIGVDFDFNIPTHTTVPLTPPVAGPPPSYGGVSPSAVIGLDPLGNPTAVQDVQFRQGGFTGATPPFGGFDAATAATFGFAILSDIEAYFVIQAAQGDTRSNILQAPKVTLFNGQTATVQDTTQEPFVTSVIPVVGDFAAAQQPVIVVLSQGTSLTVQAVVSNDRRFVRLTVVPFFSQIGDVNTFTFTGSSSSTQKSSDSKSGTDTSSNSSEDDNSSTATTVQLPTFSFVTVTTTVSVPDGGTVLLGGIKRLSEGRNERGVPVLSKLPYVNRLFRNVGIGRTTTSLMMMVTPRIIIQEEEEENLLGSSPP